MLTIDDVRAIPLFSNLALTELERTLGWRAPPVFACGNVRLSPVKRVAPAVGEGSMAIAFVHRYLQQDGR